MENCCKRPPRALSRRAQLAVLTFVLLVLGGVAALIGWGLLSAEQSPAGSPTPAGRPGWHGQVSYRYVRVDYPVLQRPAVQSAAAANLSDDAEVIGVIVGSRHRAYALAALSSEASHVLNDLVGGVPCTVTYCPREKCIHLFTDPQGRSPLAMAVGGWDPDAEEMLLRVGATAYRHKSLQPLNAGAGPFPYAEAAFQRTTWGKWRSAHPDTDVVEGDPSAAASGSGESRPQPQPLVSGPAG